MKDSRVMTVGHLYHAYEKAGKLDMQIAGHTIQRPNNVQSGLLADSFDITVTGCHIYKPSNVQIGKAKASNVAGVLGNAGLDMSPLFSLVWRALVLIVSLLLVFCLVSCNALCSVYSAF